MVSPGGVGHTEFVRVDHGDLGGNIVYLGVIPRRYGSFDLFHRHGLKLAGLRLAFARWMRSCRPTRSRAGSTGPSTRLVVLVVPVWVVAVGAIHRCSFAILHVVEMRDGEREGSEKHTREGPRAGVLYTVPKWRS